jgi:ferritin-like metal-binding protein YciE
LEPFVPLPLVDATLKEEEATDAALTTLAKSVVNVEAQL